MCKTANYLELFTAACEKRDRDESVVAFWNACCNAENAPESVVLDNIAENLNQLFSTNEPFFALAAASKGMWRIGERWAYYNAWREELWSSNDPFNFCDVDVLADAAIRHPDIAEKYGFVIETSDDEEFDDNLEPVRFRLGERRRRQGSQNRSFSAERL